MAPHTQPLRRWHRVRLWSIITTSALAALWGFAILYHTSFAYYGTWGVALTMGGAVANHFSPPLPPGTRWGGRTVDTCGHQFFRGDGSVFWLPSARVSPSPTTNMTEIILPLWMPVALGVGAAWFAHRRVRRELRQGLCQQCDYDRAGLAHTAPCPECGRMPT